MKKVGPNLIFMAIFVIAGTLFFNYDIRKSKKFFASLNKEYPSITPEERINAKITRIYSLDPKKHRNDPYQVYLVLDNTIKKDLHGLRELTTGLMLDEIVEEGDHLVKEANSYMFFLYKIKANDTLKYEFELCDVSRYPLRMKKSNN
jgi:hypothetical protein